MCSVWLWLYLTTVSIYFLEYEEIMKSTVTLYLLTYLSLSMGLRIERGYNKIDKIFSNRTDCNLYNAEPGQDGQSCNCRSGRDTFLSLDGEQYQCLNDGKYGVYVLYCVLRCICFSQVSTKNLVWKSLQDFKEKHLRMSFFGNFVRRPFLVMPNE